MNTKTKTFAIQLLKYIICIAMVVLVIGPLLVTLFTSFKTRGHIATVSPLLLPPFDEMTLQNYAKVFANKSLPVAFKNSFVIAAISIVFNILLGSVTAYCLERFKFPFKRLVFGMFFLGMVVPTYIMEIARFKVIQGMGVYNTLAAPIIIYIASDLMQLYIYRQFISNIPVSLDESALIDGCGYFRIFGQIIFPLLLPATATLIIIKSVNIINDMYVPYLYMPKNSLKTLTTFLMGYASSQQGSWQTLSAGIIVVLVPVIIIYLIFQKYIFAGITAGAVKE